MTHAHPIRRNAFDHDTLAREERARAFRMIWRGLARTVLPARGR